MIRKWKDVAEACAKEMDMNIDLDKYVGDTTSVVSRSHYFCHLSELYNVFLRDQRKIIENIKKAACHSTLYVIVNHPFPLKNSAIISSCCFNQSSLHIRERKLTHYDMSSSQGSWSVEFHIRG